MSKTQRNARVIDHALAFIPVWVVLNALEAAGTLNLARAASGVGRWLVVALRTAFPSFLPALDAFGIPMPVGLGVLMAVYLTGLRLRLGRVTWRVLVQSWLVWLLASALSSIQYSVTAAVLLWSRGYAFELRGLGLVAQTSAYQSLILVPVTVTVASAFWLLDRRHWARDSA